MRRKNGGKLSGRRRGLFWRHGLRGDKKSRAGGHRPCALCSGDLAGGRRQGRAGAQYFWVDRILPWEADASSFPYQLFHTSRPGAVDTSLVSSDHINNPRTINAVYSLGARLQAALRLGEEKLAGGGLDNKQLNEYVSADSPLAQFYKKPDTV